MYNTKNYTEQGGDLTVIGGEINVEGEINVGGNALFSGTIDFSEADMTPILTNQTASTADTIALLKADLRSEERRVGKEC